MKKTILIGATNSISNKASKWLTSIIGIFYLGLGGMKIIEQGLSYEAIGWLVIGVCFIAYSLIIYSSTPFTPKIQVSDIEITVKNKIFGKAIQILWQDIQSIRFNPYMIVFHLHSKDEVVTYSSNPETSIEIKSAIRKIADSKNIEIVGG